MDPSSNVPVTVLATSPCGCEGSGESPQAPGLPRRSLLALGAGLVMAGCAAPPGARSTAPVPPLPSSSPSQPGPPTLPVCETQRLLHSSTLRDPYGWVDTAAADDPLLLGFLRAHRTHAARVSAPLQPLVDALMRGAAQRQSAGAAGGWGRPLAAPAVRHGAWRYRTGAGPAGGWTLWRRPLQGDEETDVLSLPPETEVSMWGASPSGAHIAYAVRSGPEDGLVRVRDVASGQDLPDRVERVRVNIDLTEIVWSADGRGFLYSEVNAQGRPWRACLHRLGTAQAADRVLFEDPDPANYVTARRTTSGAYAVIDSSSNRATEVRLLPLHAPGLHDQTVPVLVQARRPGHHYVVDEAGGTLLILSNDRHPNRRLFTAPVARPGEWQEVLPPSDRAGLTWHLALDRHWVVSERAEAVDRIRVIDRASGAQRLIDFPDAVYTAGFDRWSAGPEVNKRSDADELLIGYESFVRPKTLLRYRLDSGTLQPLGQPSPATVNPADYVVERLFAPSADGVQVPVSLLRRADRPARAHAGLVLYGYGAYGNAVQATFDAARLGLLDHGVMFALAHVRGGDENGGRWTEAGQGRQRDRPLADFVACARHLVRSGSVRAGAIVAEGHSAGGWLAAAAAQQAPELFAATLLHVPYLDVLTDLMNPDSSMAPMEREVSGDPLADPEALARLLTLDPYRNLPAQGARAVHLTAVMADARIPWRGVVKFAARAAAGGAAPLVVHLAEEGSHWGPADLDTARRWPHERMAFAIACLGAHRPGGGTIA